jgi:hypothetical protein
MTKESDKKFDDNIEVHNVREFFLNELNTHGEEGKEDGDIIMWQLRSHALVKYIANKSIFRVYIWAGWYKDSNYDCKTCEQLKDRLRWVKGDILDHKKRSPFDTFGVFNEYRNDRSGWLSIDF